MLCMYVMLYMHDLYVDMYVCVYVMYVCYDCICLCMYACYDMLCYVMLCMLRDVYVLCMYVMYVSVYI